MYSGAILIVEQRFLRGPSLWSGQPCLVSLVDMGPLAHALSSDVPGLGEQVLSLFPGMQDFADAMTRGSYLAEVLGRLALELQAMAGAPPHARCASMVHGRQAQARIIIAARLEPLAVQAFALARDILLALWAGQSIVLHARLAALGRTVRQSHPEPWRPAHRPPLPAEAASALAARYPFAAAQAQQLAGARRSAPAAPPHGQIVP